MNAVHRRAVAVYGAPVLLYVTLSAWLQTGTAHAADIKPKCELANAVKPIGDFTAGNLIGFANTYGPYLIIGLVAILVFMAASRKAPGLVRAIVGSFAALLLLGVLAANTGLLGSAGCTG